MNWRRRFQLSGESLLLTTRPITVSSWRSSFFLSLIRSLQSSITCCGVSSSSLQWQSGDSTLLMSHKNLFRLMWPFRRLSRYTSVALEHGVFIVVCSIKLLNWPVWAHEFVSRSHRCLLYCHIVPLVYFVAAFNLCPWSCQ